MYLDFEKVLCLHKKTISMGIYSLGMISKEVDQLNVMELLCTFFSFSPFSLEGFCFGWERKLATNIMVQVIT